MGTQLFPEPVTGKKESLAAVRTSQRSRRRNLDRRQDRLKRVRSLFKEVEFGLMPDEAGPGWFQVRKGDLRPIDLRVKGLEELLDKRELARVLYDLCKHRGYIPHGIATAEDDDDGKVKAALKENAKAIAASGCKTVGQWLMAQQKSMGTNAITRNHGKSNYVFCVTNEQLVDEICYLFKKQRELGSVIATRQLENRFLEEMTWQKDTSARDERSYSQVGNCTYFSNKRRAAKASLDNELVSAYEAFSRVSIVSPDASKRTLPKSKINGYIDVLFSPISLEGNKECKVTYLKLRRELCLSNRDRFIGVDRDEESKKEVFNPRGWRMLRDTLLATRPGLLMRLHDDIDLANDVIEAVTYSSSRRVLKDKLDSMPLSSGEAEALCNLPYNAKVFNGYAQRSHDALNMLLGAFKDNGVCTLAQAEEATGLLEFRLSGKRLSRGDRLMPYESYLALTGKTNNNPRVLRAISQMRKVVNRLCGKYGVPNEIHVELARELKLSRKANDAIDARIKANEAENERIKKEIIAEYGISEASFRGWMITKVKMYKRQKCLDLYTGEELELERVLKEEHYSEIDHILPISRTGDNSVTNKVLVRGNSNQNKGDRTPYEWMHSGEAGAPDWDKFVTRVIENKQIRKAERTILFNSDLGANTLGFISRNLEDTGYMSREALGYLNECFEWPDDGRSAHVLATKGRATAWLRHAWGLDFGGKGQKDRTDPRHHAIDALVIAACNAGTMQKTAIMSSRMSNIGADKRNEMLKSRLPWRGFADEARALYAGIPIHRHVPRKATGAAFEETIYSYEGRDKNGKLVGKTGGKEKKKVSGNAVVLDDGKSFKILGDMVCLRLWHDPRAGKNGKWYADPIYVADMPAVKAGSYVPKIAKAHSSRDLWPAVPENAMREKPVEIYMGDIVHVGCFVGRFNGFDIDGANWKFDLIQGERMPTINGGLDNTNRPVVQRG